MKIAVIGAGPAGMTAAYQLSKKGHTVDVFEASNAVGGMSKTLSMWGQKVDIGPHRFFSNDTRINELWLEVVGNDYEMVDRLTRIYYNKRFFHYPIKAFDALKNLGVFNAMSCVVSYGVEKLSPAKDKTTFEGWVTNRFGKKLYNVFFKTYTEKLWGIPCNVLDADFAAQRIKKFSLGEAMKTAVFGNKGNHKTLVDQFAYPHGGTGMVYERMAAFVKNHEGNIFLNKPIKRVLTKDKRAYAIELEDGIIQEYDYIVSSMPLSLLVSRLPEVPEKVKTAANALKFRNTIIVYLNVNAKNLFPDNWLYIHSADLMMGRLTNFRNWSPHLYGEQQSTICALEYWCYDEDDFWSWDDSKLIELGKEELRKTGLIGNAEITDGNVCKIHRCYPVYSKGYKETLSSVVDYLKEIEKLQVIGRYGAFKYNNQDHSILMGKLAAENIAESKNHNLWDINTDYEDYQEQV
ncbi:MAG: FAD-dependent oxidoreductase [Bacteroidetes bacterium]|nr:FAD-dependent oxidoreductase [Bacteroidota bacterium]